MKKSRAKKELLKDEENEDVIKAEQDIVAEAPPERGRQKKVKKEELDRDEEMLELHETTAAKKEEAGMVKEEDTEDMPKVNLPKTQSSQIFPSQKGQG